MQENAEDAREDEMVKETVPTRSSRRGFLTIAGTAASGGVLTAASQPAAARQYTIDSDLRIPVSTTGEALDQAIAASSPGSPLVGLGDVFLDVQEQYGINAIYQAAHAAHESAWGRSWLARRKNNLFGWSAFDRCPGTCADSFASDEACVRQVMGFIDEKYISKNGRYYVAATLNGMNVNYATDPRWAEKIAAIMRTISDNLEEDTPREEPPREDPPGDEPTFEPGAEVVATEDVNLRTSPAIGNNVAFTLPEGAQGVIEAGPTRNDGFDFWKIDYEGFEAGPRWSVEEALALEQQTSTTTDQLSGTGVAMSQSGTQSRSEQGWFFSLFF
jgi:hypothetical protein